jgi:hypothetical protein
MSQPNWFIISVLETNKSLESLTHKFHQFCCLQPGSQNHGWKTVSSNPHRYLYQLISTVPVHEEAIFDLSIMLHTTEGKVISEATNCVADTTPQFTHVYILDAGDIVSDKDNIFFHLSGYSVSVFENIMTIRFTRDNLEKSLDTKTRLDHLISLTKEVKVITVFNNWKN